MSPEQRLLVKETWKKVVPIADTVDYDAKRNGFRQSGFARLFQALC
jgi:hypothetical protein